jgi:hypothetical protein
MLEAVPVMTGVAVEFERVDASIVARGVVPVVKSAQGTNNPTGEVMLVTNVATNTLTLVRQIGDGGSGGGLLQQNDIVWIIGNANEEGADLRTMKGTTIAEVLNYCQIFRTTIGVTETSRNTKGLTKENDFDYQIRKKGIEHLVDIERAFLFGKKEIITSGTHPKRFTGGVLPRISQVTSNVATRDDFNSYLRILFAHGNTEKYLLASGYVIDKINGFAHDKLQVLQGEKTFGLTILKYLSPHGTLNMSTPTPLLPYKSPASRSCLMMLSVPCGERYLRMVNPKVFSPCSTCNLS